MRFWRMGGEFVDEAVFFLFIGSESMISAVGMNYVWPSFLHFHSTIQLVHIRVLQAQLCNVLVKLSRMPAAI